MTLWTIGHSTRPIDEFLALLKAHDIRQLVDVRTVPKSRHNPQFNTDRLAKSLKKAGLGYLHMPQLGGLRKAKKDSINTGWRNASFRGYADYMQTDQFVEALEELMAYGTDKSTAIMCAEAVPWRCHRSLIADALTSQGWTVVDIMTEQRADPHRLTPFAKMTQGRVTYPAPMDEQEPRLFD
ncbi:DUF488 family protein [Nitrospira moscoviensis]|uniref:HhH-GPD domain-containing protein n=1 Tax=Nitrospira moscoviensis TaxID=42253 RepID=A0A0K2GHT2_NITMO|nr:DUF488 domain-containing protein [Nitrospira moscoviensis]ALA60510.1 hypothetical protein NITMOv2_4128 [Nitrospira moscoviensis]